MHLAQIYEYKARARVMVVFNGVTDNFDVHKEFYPLWNAIKKATRTDHLPEGCYFSYGETEDGLYGPVLVDFVIEEEELPDYPFDHTPDELQAEEDHSEQSEAAIKRIKLLCKHLNLEVLEHVEVKCTEIEDNPEWYK